MNKIQDYRKEAGGMPSKVWRGLNGYAIRGMATVVAVVRLRLW